MASERGRALASGPVILALVGSGCVLPTPLGELPAESSDGTDSGGSTSMDPGATSMASTTAEGSSSADTGMIGPAPMHAWVLRFDEWQDAMPTGSGGAESGGGDGDSGGMGGPPPETLMVQISTGFDSCEDPWVPLQCGEQWNILMQIPPELQAPGTYDLFEQLNAIVTVTGPVEPGGFCSGGGGTLLGQVELFTVDQQEVTGRLFMTDAFDFDANVEFEADGC